jgi:hypothetical protein
VSESERDELCRLRKEVIELQTEKNLETSGRVFCPGDDPVTRFGVRFGVTRRGR